MTDRGRGLAADNWHEVTFKQQYAAMFEFYVLNCLRDVRTAKNGDSAELVYEDKQNSAGLRPDGDGKENNIQNIEFLV